MKGGVVLSLVVLSLCICYVFCQVKTDNMLRGVDPSKLTQYQTTSHFQCLDKSQMIPNTHVNDDYCDCNDGSDEPGTSACSNSRFYCRNAGYLPKSIPASHVNDGVCDCCDASDEWKTGVCNNTCQAEGRSYIQSVKREIRSLVRGLDRRNSVWLPKAKEIIQHKQSEKKLKQDELSTLDSQISQLSSQVESLRSNKDSATAEKSSIEAQYATPTPTPTPSPEAQDSDEQSEQEVLDKIEEQINPVYPDDVKNKLDQLETVISDFNKLENDLRELENNQRQIKTNVEDLEKELNYDYGSNSVLLALKGETFEFRDSKYTYTFKPFNEVVQDSSVNLGRYEGKDNKALERDENGVLKQKYTGGTRCWNGPDRSVVVEFSCGREEKIKEVSEPNKCEYLMRFETSMVCEDAKVAELRGILEQAGEKEEKEEEEWSILKYLTREKNTIS